MKRKRKATKGKNPLTRASQSRFRGISGERIRPDTLKRTLGEHKLLCACFVLALLVFTICVAALNRPPVTEPVRYALETHGSEIDFAAPGIQAHTADAGIAVIGGPADAAAHIAPTTAAAPAEAPAPVKLAADPAAIWTESPGETAAGDAASATHSGFTLPVPMDGDSIGILTIPDIGLSVRVYESEDDMADMEKGAAHFKSTSAWMGNIGVSAHNIALDGTPGYFMNLHTLAPGAVIFYETAHGSREYIVENIVEIEENDWSMLDRTDDNRITLITCVSGKPEMRLCVQGKERMQNEE